MTRQVENFALSLVGDEVFRFEFFGQLSRATATRLISERLLPPIGAQVTRCDLVQIGPDLYQFVFSGHLKGFDTAMRISQLIIADALL